MTATLSRIVTDRLGNEVMIVHPDFDSQLSDPAFAPAGTQQYDLPYKGWTDKRSFLVLVQQKVSAAGRALLAALVQRRIDLIDAIAQYRSDYSLWETRTNQWPTPTQIQQALITAAAVQAANSLQAVQDIVSDITTREGQIP